MNIENEHTFLQSLRDGINLFFGSGFSILAKDSRNRYLPTGKQLAAELMQQFDLAELDSLDLPQIVTVIEAERREELYTYLTERFSVHSFDERYGCLNDRINIETIFTTNIDDLLFKVFARNEEHYLNDVSLHGPAYGDRSAIDIVPLHGSVARVGSLMTFSSLDIASSFPRDPDKWHFLTGKIQRTPTLFWGYSLTDAGVLQALSPHSIREREQKAKWIILCGSADAEIQFFRSLGFQIILSETEEMLDYISSLDALVTKSAVSVPKSARELFPDESIPAIGTVPANPIIDFYLGSEPTWHDIYSGGIYKTSCYTRVLDFIHSNKSTIALGMAASGKTTLMMQLASDISFHGYKLISRSLSLEKAKFILRKLRDEQALVFVDNLSDDIDAFTLLSEAPNILVVGFDRDYSFDIVSHRIHQDRFNILDITELNRADAQQLFSRIPSGIRSDLYKEPVMEEGAVLSIYEFVESNIAAHSLRERFSSVLRHLMVADEMLHDLLIMCCYVHACHAPVSFDMANAFLRDETAIGGDIQTAYGIISDMLNDRLGALISEYIGSLVDTEQDHFIPRSTIVSEAVLREVNSEAFKRVLLRFHENVSPLRICNYDVFRRKAYDERYATRAFRHWEEGKKFYEMAYEIDGAPQLLQQGALYLGHKNRFDEAFPWIDRALMLTGSRNMSIRNSHAILLFTANISKAPSSDETVQRMLKRSMSILAECYSFDKRKRYHATKFADHALRYWDVYGDDAARDYLTVAEKWLTEEQKKAEWHRGVRRLHRQVSAVLRRVGERQTDHLGRHQA